MNEEEKLLWVFEQVHGKMTGSCYAQVEYEDDGTAIVSCMKNGVSCWSRNKIELVFEYITKHLD